MDIDRSQGKPASLRKFTNEIIPSDKKDWKKCKTIKATSSLNSRFSNTRSRRCRANARERDRMHCLNAALDNLRKYLPIGETIPRLSKIETLRMARNYIAALSEALQCGPGIDVFAFAKILCCQMSSPTIHSIADNFKVDGSMLCTGESKQNSTFFVTSVAETVDVATRLLDNTNSDFEFGYVENSQQSFNSEKDETDCLSFLALYDGTRGRDSELIHTLENEEMSFQIENNII